VSAFPVCRLTNLQGKDEINSTALTLRFKHGRHTILLFAQPLTPFSSIKSDLLAVLRERYPSGIQGPPPSTDLVPIPDSILDVILGVPVDQYDMSKGWTELDTTAGGEIRESPKSLGVKDGSAIAFAFVTGDDAEERVGDGFWVEFSNVDELYPEEDAEVEPVVPERRR